MAGIPIDSSLLESLPDIRHAQMTSILDLSYQMLHSARTEDWENLTKSESERSTLMKKFFSEPSTADTAVAIEQCIRQILSMDKEILALTEKTRNSLGAQLNQFKTGQKARKAYQQNSR